MNSNNSASKCCYININERLQDADISAMQRPDQHNKKIEFSFEESGYLGVYDAAYKRLTEILRNAGSRAKKKGLAFEIDNEFIDYLFEQQLGKCALTGIRFFATEGKKKSPFTISLDRIDARKGYTEDNVRLVCFAVNMVLFDWGEDVFDVICAARHELISP